VRVLTAAHLASARVLSVATPTPRGLAHPPAVYIYNVIIPVVGSLIILALALDSLRARRLTWAFLFVICSALTWWMETMGDWGQELVYSPALSHYHVSWLPWSTPNDPYFMPFTYAVYWTVHAWVVLTLAGRLAEWKHMSLLKAVVILSVPVGVVWDLSVETLSAYFGWWTYNPGFGPEIIFAHGRQPLLWPLILLCIWPNFVAYMSGKPNGHGLNTLEKAFGLGRLVRPRAVPAAPTPALVGAAAPTGSTLAAPPSPTSPRQGLRAAGGRDYQVIGTRWRFELARFGAWMATFQLSFFVMLVIPLVSLRLITGHDSIYVP
jgi:hypothetical protein